MPWEKVREIHSGSKLTLVFASVAWTALVVAVSRFIDFNEPYLPFAIAGAFVFYLHGRPSRWEIYAWLLISAVFLKIIHLPEVPFWVLRVASGMAALGLGAILLLGLEVFRSKSSGRERALALLAPSLALVCFIVATAWALRWTGILNPRTDDAWLYAFDGSLGFQPGFLIGRVMYRSLFLTRVTLLTYLSLPFAMAVVCAWRIPTGSTRSCWQLLGVLLLAGLAGGALYNVIPVTGPLYAFSRDFPWHSVAYRGLQDFALQKMAIPVGIPRNGMPSLHVAWVVLLCWNSRGLPSWLRRAMLLYALLTVIATLGSGQHYLMDLVVSIPFALAVQAALAWSHVGTRQRAGAFAAGVALTTAWLMLIRYGFSLMLVSSIIPWVLVLASLALSFWLEASGARSNQNNAIKASGQKSLQAHSAASGRI
jgi:PAP2 superfamily